MHESAFGPLRRNRDVRCPAAVDGRPDAPPTRKLRVNRVSAAVECAEPVMARANGYHFFIGRNDFPDRYDERISSAQWKSLKREVIKQRGSRCQRCGEESVSLALHHLHYRSLGNEQLEDVELLCSECHKGADELREAKGRPKRDYPQEGLIVGPDGEHWGKFDPDTSYLVLADGRNVPIKFKKGPSSEKLKGPGPAPT